MTEPNFLVSSASPSSIKTLMTCERKHFLTYSRQWEKKGISLGAHFGVCMHKAWDVVWTEKDKDQVLGKSFAAFMNAWSIEGVEEDSKRNPHTAQIMLSHYIDRRWDYIQGCEVLGVEKEFIIDIDVDGNTIRHICIIDKIFRRAGSGVISWNHKTTSSYKANPVPGFAYPFIQGFKTDWQMFSEAYVMMKEYGDEFEGHYADLALVHSTKHNVFQILPITLFHDSLEIWLEEFKERMRRLHLSRKMMEDGESLSRAFPRNLTSCVQFNTICSFHKDICSEGGEEGALGEMPSAFQPRTYRGRDVGGEG